MYVVDLAICWQILVDDQTWFETTFPSITTLLSLRHYYLLWGLLRTTPKVQEVVVGWEVLHFDNLSNNLPISLFSLSTTLREVFHRLVSWFCSSASHRGARRLSNYWFQKARFFFFQPPAAYPTPVSYLSSCQSSHLFSRLFSYTSSHQFFSPVLSYPSPHHSNYISQQPTCVSIFTITTTTLSICLLIFYSGLYSLRGSYLWCGFYPSGDS